MIKQSTIESVRAKMDIREVLDKFITIKKNVACCPFHNEKTPSMHIWQSQQTFKCFGCGESGDAISFVMKHEKKTYPETIEWLAEFYNLPVEYEDTSREETQERKDRLIEMRETVKYAQGVYHKTMIALPADSIAKTYLSDRGIQDEIIQRWGIGFAPDDFKFLTTPLINMGRYEPATDTGLIYTKEGNSWDFFRNRITFPIHDINGNITGFGGRMLPTGDPAADRKTPKYLNSKESLLYNKAKTWFGLYQALTAKAIKSEGFAYLVEGYTDVISMHEAGVRNTIAGCGTEMHDDMLKLLKRYTDHVVIALDGDNSGIKKIALHIDRLLAHDFRVEMLQLPGGLDPDEFIRSQQNQLSVAA